MSPKKMSSAYFAVGFAVTAVAAKISLLYERNLIKALLVGLAAGVILYFGSVVYVYNKIEFE